LRARRTLSNWLTTKYLLIIRNEENFAEKTTLSFNYAKLLVFFMAFFILMMILSLYLVKTILAQWYDPRHAQLEDNKKLIQMSMSIDSLELEVDRKNQFIDNFQEIVYGETDDDEQEEEINLLKTDLTSLKSNALGQLHPIDSQFRREFEEAGFDFISLGSGNAELQELFFFSPISGIVSGPFNQQVGHYGVDVVAKSNEPVMCVADGTVIFADFDFSDSGYVIGVQHRSNLVSIYKHNSAILKKVGNFVSAGEIISIIGNTGELTSGPHLHFELWYDGNPVNPEEFISF